MARRKRRLVGDSKTSSPSSSGARMAEGESALLDIQQDPNASNASDDFAHLSEAEGRRKLAQYQQDPSSPHNAAALAEDRETYGKPTRDTPYVMAPDYPGHGPYKPTRYTPELATRFCELVASTTMSLQQIGRECGVPANIFLKWCSRYDELGASYARAREQQQHLRADELLEIVDDSSNDWVDVETKSGRIIRQFDHEHAKRSELRIRTRQWLMSRFAPRVFGERLQLDASKETREAIAAKPDAVRLAEARELIARARRRVAEAFASGEVSEADFEDVGGDSEQGVSGVLTRQQQGV
jgi:hypothetical protein